MISSITRRMVQSLAICSLLAVGALAQVSTGPALALPTDGATGVVSPLTVSWGAVAGATYYGAQVSVNTTFTGGMALNQTNLTTTSSVAATLTGSTLYYWRAGAGTATGAANMTWSSIWTFTTAATAPAAPTLTAPGNGAGNQATALTLSWSSPATALSFGVQLSTSTAFTSNILNGSGLTAASAAVSPLAYSTVYYWHANATNAVGTSAWSTTRSFTTQANPVFPGVPTLNSPANNAQNQATALTLGWNSSANALRYNMELSTSSAFSSFVVNATGLTTLSRPVTGLVYSTTYFWQVNAVNDSGTSAWSTVRSFTVQPNPALPTVPTLLSPAAYATNQATSLTLSWNSSTNALRYAVQLSTSSAFATAVVNATGLTALSQPVSGLAYSTTYYWEVNASNDSGSSAWSTVRNFTVQADPTAPGVPVLISPANNAQNQATSLTLSWNSAANAVSYAVRVSTSTTFAPTVLSLTGVADLSAPLPGLAYSTTYYWQVNSSSATATSAWSTVRAFTTAAMTIAAPSLALPATGITGLKAPVALSWGTTANAASYTVQIATDYSFSSTVTSIAGITGTATSVSSLPTNATYFWRVQGISGTTRGTWSSIWWFTIGNTATLPGQFAEPVKFSMSRQAISYSVARAMPVSIAIYDLRGNRVCSFERLQSGGSYSFELGKQGLAAGRYLIHFKAGAIDRRAMTQLFGRR